MSNNQYHELTVIQSTQITKNMRRVIFSGNSLDQLPDGLNSSYIKLYFNSDGTAIQTTNELLSNKPKDLIKRTYTIRKLCKKIQTLTVDFVIHSHDTKSGIAQQWATLSKIGDPIVISCSKKPLLVKQPADWFLLAGDMTALPAISCNLEILPDNAKGYAIIQIIDEQDIQLIPTPKNIQLIWIRETPNESALIKQIKSINWLSGSASVWVACEFDDMKALRQYIKKEKQVSSNRLYISSYWKKGLTEEQHKIKKREDADKV